MEDYDSDKVGRILRTREYVDGLLQVLMEGTSNEALIEELVECVDIASDQTNLPEIAKLAKGL